MSIDGLSYRSQLQSPVSVCASSHALTRKLQQISLLECSPSSLNQEEMSPFLLSFQEEPLALLGVASTPALVLRRVAPVPGLVNPALLPAVTLRSSAVLSNSSLLCGVLNSSLLCGVLNSSLLGGNINSSAPLIPSYIKQHCLTGSLGLKTEDLP